MAVNLIIFLLTTQAQTQLWLGAFQMSSHTLSGGFVGVLILIFVGIKFFQSFYLSNILYLSYFNGLMSVFLLSMLILLGSGLNWTLFLAWEGLGVSSGLLVLYYMSLESVSGTLWTVLSNRVGDALLICFLVWSSFTFKYLLLLILAGATKSALWPWGSWLPRAMSAPTPASSLVHSSTLVVAGVLVYIMTENLLPLNLGVVIMSSSLLSILASALLALLEKDYKKVVALSTLSQISLGALLFSLGAGFMCLTHLMVHACLKSLLFISVGVKIHQMWGGQESRQLHNGESLSNQLVLNTSLISLSGLFLLSGSVSKELILEFLGGSGSSSCLTLTLILCFLLTVLYSLRLSGFNNNMTPTHLVGISMNQMASQVLLFSGSIWFASVLSVNLMPPVSLISEEALLWGALIILTSLPLGESMFFHMLWCSMSSLSILQSVSSLMVVEVLGQKGYRNFQEIFLSNSSYRMLVWGAPWGMLTLLLFF